MTSVELAGSRSLGTHDELSDWDFAVTTSDFESLAPDLPRLVEPLEPLAALWEPLGHFPVYTLVLRGPTVVEYLFLDHSQTAAPPVTATAEALPAIDAHFWQWLWWLATKAAVGRDDLLGRHWPAMYRHLLEPMGAEAEPDSIEAAARIYRAGRAELEQQYSVEVPRALEAEVCSGMRRLGHRV